MASSKEVGEEELDPGGKNLGKQVEEYLTSIKRELSDTGNPRLKVERARLQDLLESYKKLCTVYSKKKDNEENRSKRLEEIPEIYGILYPDLYKDKRESEKDKLRKSLVKGRVGDPCVPPNCRVQTSSRTNLVDTRQKEKDRFVRLVSSAPSAFLQGPPSQRRSLVSRRLITSSARPAVKHHPDERDKEKERLARILSSDLDSNPGLKKRIPPAKKSFAPISKNNPARKEIVRNTPSTKPTRPTNNAEGTMVKRDAGGVPKRLVTTTLDKIDRRKKILDLKNKEYQEYIDKFQGRQVPKMDKATLAREASILDLRDTLESSPRASVSVATQTDNLLVFPTPPQTPDGDKTDSEKPKMFPVQKETFITSPRAKLIKDLLGVSPCLPGASPLLTLPDQGVCEEKRKRTAYAEALKAQIDEKKRIEGEKRRKELEEDECIEKRAREQQERLKEEWEREQSLRQDWLQQKEAQEESMRQRLAELDLEAKEFKHRERQRKSERLGVEGGWISPAGSVTPTGPRPGLRLSPREVEQLLPQAMRDSMMTSLLEKPRPKTLALDNGLLSSMEGEVGGQLFSDALKEREDKGKSSGGDGVKERTNGRPTSPVLPAVQTDSLLRRSIYASPRLEFIQGENEKDELLRGDKILTQLGVFRRELELEQERLQQRLQEQAQS